MLFLFLLTSLYALSYISFKTYIAILFSKVLCFTLKNPFKLLKFMLLFCLFSSLFLESLPKKYFFFKSSLWIIYKIILSVKPNSLTVFVVLISNISELAILLSLRIFISSLFIVAFLASFFFSLNILFINSQYFSSILLNFVDFLIFNSVLYS